MFIKKSKTKGFTLIELLVVVSIISLLASVVLASLNSARAKARDSQRIQSVRSVQTALEMYYNDNGYYPKSADNFFHSNTTLREALVPKYISSLPLDPSGVSNNYRYFTAYNYGTIDPVYNLIPPYYAIRINYEAQTQCFVCVNNINSTWCKIPWWKFPRCSGGIQ